MRVTDPELNPNEWAEEYGKDYYRVMMKNFGVRTKAVQEAANHLKTHPYERAAPFSPEQAERSWTPAWSFGSLGFLTKTVHEVVLKKDVPNLLHPALRSATRPIAWTALVASALNTSYQCHLAQLDDRTNRYQTAATLTWQLLNNIALPLFTFRALALAVPSTTAAVYGSALFALTIPFLTGQRTKFEVEKVFMRRRYNRKDYGSHGQTYETTSFQRDSPADQLEQLWNDQGNENILHQDDEVLYAHLFPFFSLAEALPTHEVPFHGGELGGIEPLAASGAVLQQSMERERNGRPRSVPAPTPNTSLRFSKRFAEFSIATEHQTAADLMYINTLRKLVSQASREPVEQQNV
jgi:hypothetical protein